jgi:hypothetical protein
MPSGKKFFDICGVALSCRPSLADSGNPVLQYVVDPVLFNLALALASLWPLWRIFRRAGLNPLWSLLIFVSVAIPRVGQRLVLLVLFHSKWPTLPPKPPAPPRKARRVA